MSNEYLTIFNLNKIEPLRLITLKYEVYMACNFATKKRALVMNIPGESVAERLPSVSKAEA